MTKNGLPAVLSWSNCASGVTRCGSQRRASAISRPKSFGASGARTISCTTAPDCRISSNLRINGWLESTSLSRKAPVNIRWRTSWWVKDILEQVERRCIQPLQIIKEEGKWVFRSRKYVDKSSKYELEPALCVLGRKIAELLAALQ